LPSSDVPKSADPRIVFATRLLSRRISKPDDSVGEIATLLHLSSSRFRHLFKQEVGITPKRYVKQLRLRQAKQLLETSLLSVKEVSARVGVNDISHFVRDFKARFGINPSEVRRRAAQDAESTGDDQIGQRIANPANTVALFSAHQRVSSSTKPS
jgi:transcriptional regulator GlxA family with amidase domain